MECSVVFRCECNDKTYPTKSALNSHKKTKSHKAYEEEKEYTILCLNNTLKLLEDFNTTLIKRT